MLKRVYVEARSSDHYDLQPKTLAEALEPESPAKAGERLNPAQADPGVAPFAG